MPHPLERRQTRAEIGVVKEIKGNLKDEYEQLGGVLDITRWGLYVLARVVIMVLMLVIA
jgi:hypothetical protein